MRALTLSQPWATLVAIGAKKIETRSWRPSYRGPLAIHAAKGFPKAARDLLAEMPFYETLHFKGALDDYRKDPLDRLPRGHVIAICQLVTIKNIGFDELTFPDGEQFYINKNISSIWYLTAQEKAFGDYTAGRYAWLLGNVQKLETPLPAKGALGLWEWDEKGL